MLYITDWSGTRCSSPNHSNSKKCRSCRFSSQCGDEDEKSSLKSHGKCFQNIDGITNN